MYRVIKANEEIPEIIQKVRIRINIEVLNSSDINCSESIDIGNNMFPGVKKFEEHVNIIMEEFDFDVKKHWITNNAGTGSISVYFVVYYALTENKSIECLVQFKVSDHDSNDYFYEDHHNHIRRIRDEFEKDSTKEIGILDEIIKVNQEIYRNYSDGLDDIRYQLKDYIDSWKREYKTLINRSK